LENDVIKVIMSRRSVRNFKKEQINENNLITIIEAGRAAPSGGNERLTHIIVIQNSNILQKLINISKKEFAKMIIDENTYKGLSSTIEHAHIVDFHFNYTYFAPTFIVTAHKKGHTNAMADSVCVLENMIIAATALKIGSCYINPVNWLDDSQGFREFMYTIGLNPNETITGGLVIGYPENEMIFSSLPHSRTGNPVSYVR